MAKFLISGGDPMIPSTLFEGAYKKHMKKYFNEMAMGDWESNWGGSLQDRRLKVEQNGPEIEIVPDIIKEHSDAEVLTGLFVPVSKKLIDTMPNLRMVGLARAGKENINLKRGNKKRRISF